MSDFIKIKKRAERASDFATRLPSLGEFTECHDGVETDRADQLDELGYVHTAAAALAAGHEHLRRAHSSAEFSLRQARTRSQLAHKAGHPPVNRSVVSFCRHACEVRRFAALFSLRIILGAA